MNARILFEPDRSKPAHRTRSGSVDGHPRRRHVTELAGYFERVKAPRKPTQEK